ncbi:hypothetical protein Thpro_021802 [Acidihalobacter prosperus]|uniref:Uncharacterized protein n=1 Tax=Acidihalobacter prosperus TaxID=160660 RepID=A0A1A6C4J7_9GAMM|nr:hypothetical protein Thpro_021802 [Acidihalobacter prosperus]
MKSIPSKLFAHAALRTAQSRSRVGAASPELALRLALLRLR